MTSLPYGRLQQLATGVHVLDGPWRRSPMLRRMTVIEGCGDHAGELALHSAIRLEEEDFGILDGLGRVALILVPNKFHGSDASFYAERYPDAKVLVPRQVEANLRKKLSRIDGVLDEGLAWGDDLTVFPLAGTRLGEVVFHHPKTRTLITTDLVFHYRRDDFKGLARFLMRLNGALDNFGPTRLAKKFFIKDRVAFAESMRPILDLEIEHVIMSHGRVVERNGGERMRAAFADFVNSSSSPSPSPESS